MLPPDELDRLREGLGRLEPAARAELLIVLSSTAHVRADVIRQFYERPSVREMAETLIDLEEDDLARAAVIDALKELRFREE